MLTFATSLECKVLGHRARGDEDASNEPTPTTGTVSLFFSVFKLGLVVLNLMTLKKVLMGDNPVIFWFVYLLSYSSNIVDFSP